MQTGVPMENPKGQMCSEVVEELGSDWMEEKGNPDGWVDWQMI